MKPEGNPKPFYMYQNERLIEQLKLTMGALEGILIQQKLKRVTKRVIESEINHIKKLIE